MTVSIVIPVYNGAATIAGLVERLVGVLGADGLQIVLVNDGSPDDSHAVCLGLNARSIHDHSAVDCDHYSSKMNSKLRIDLYFDNVSGA